MSRLDWRTYQEIHYKGREGFRKFTFQTEGRDMRSRLAILVALLSPAALTAADPVATFGGTTHFRTARLGTIVDLTFTPDGRTIVAGHVQRLGLTAWDAATGNTKWTAELNRIATADDNLRMVVPMQVLAVGDEVLTLEAAAENRWRIARFDAATGRRKQPTALPFDTHPREFRFSADGKLLAYHEGLTCRIADVATGQERTSIVVNCHYLLRRSIAFAPDGKVVAFCKGDDFFDTHDLATGKFIARFPIPNEFEIGGNWSPEYSRDGKWLLAQKGDGGSGELFAFDTATRERREIGPSSIGSRWALAPGGGSLLLTRRLDAGHDRGILAAYDYPAPNARVKLRWSVETPRSVRNLAYSPDGKTIAAASMNAVTLYDTATGDRLPQSADRVGGFAMVQAAGGQYVTAADDLETWDARTGERKHVLPAPTDRGHWAALAANGRYAVWEALTATGATVEVWDRTTGKRTVGPVVRGGHSHVTGVTGEGRVLLIGPDTLPGKYLLRTTDLDDPTRWKSLVMNPPGTPPIATAASSADGRLLAVHTRFPATFPGLSGEAIPKLIEQLHWHDATGRKFGETEPFGCDAPPRLAVSPDGSLVALSDWTPTHDAAGRYVRVGLGVKLFAVKPGDGQKPLFRFPVGSRPRAMGFSPDGRTLAAVHDAGNLGYRVALYETCSGLPRATYPLPDAGQAVAFTPDGTHLAVAVSDGPCVVFDMWAPNGSSDSRVWEQLLSSDGEQAFAAMKAMAANPAVSVQFLRDRVKPAAAFAAADLAKLVAELDAPAYADREAATKQLRELVMDYRPVLQGELDRTPSAEVRERLEALLKRTDAAGGQMLRQFRAIEVLGRINTPEARAVLAAVANGDPSRRLNATAKSTLGK